MEFAQVLYLKQYKASIGSSNNNKVYIKSKNIMVIQFQPLHYQSLPISVTQNEL